MEKERDALTWKVAMDEETELAIRRIANVLDPPRYYGPPTPPRRPPGFGAFAFYAIFGLAALWAGLKISYRAAFGFPLGKQFQFVFAGFCFLSFALNLHNIFQDVASRKKLLKEWAEWNKSYPDKAKHFGFW